MLRNAKSPAYRKEMEAGKSAEDIKAEADRIQAELGELKPKMKELEDAEGPILEEFEQLMLTIPQPADPDVPIGKDDTENTELRTVGEIRKFDFEPLDHVALGQELGIIDIERGVKLAGARNYILRATVPFSIRPCCVWPKT